MTTVSDNTVPVKGERRYGQGISKTKTAVAVLVLWVLSMVVQTQLDPRRHYYNPMLEKGARANFIESLRNNMFGASFLGFREVVAGMLWVKADELFHEGKYQDLVPYFSLVTFMDPHQVDVYSTGAWHLMYNFGDPRMITQGTSFLREGIKNNPNVWDLYFQMGWVSFDWPVEDYATALPFFRNADEHNGVNGDPPPAFISHMAAHALTRMGKVKEAEAQWQKNLSFAEKQMADATRRGSKEDITFWQQERDVCRANLDRVVVREIARQDLPRNPKDVRITATVKRLQPRVLVVNAKLLGLPHMTSADGSTSNARLEIVLQDKDYDKLLARHANDFSWIGKHLTKYRSIYNIVEANGVVTDKGQPGIKVELNKDPMLDPPRNPTDLYPLESEDYELILRFDPSVRRQPEEVQDILGWTGEGLKQTPQVVKGVSGQRMLEMRIPLKKEDIV